MGWTKYLWPFGKKDINVEDVNPSTSSNPIALLRSLFGMRIKDSPQDLIKKFRSWVYLAARLNSEQVGQAKLRLYAKGGTSRFPTKKLSRKQYSSIENHPELYKQLGKDEITELTDHPALQLVRHFNNYNTSREGFELTDLYLELLGNSYWYVPQNNLGIPQCIYPLLSHLVQVVPGTDEIVKGYIYNIKPEPVKFAAEEIIHFRFPNPGSLYYGVGPMQAATKAFSRNESGGDYEDAFFRNGGSPELIVKYLESVSEPERIKFEKQWNIDHRGKHKAFSTAFIEGDIELEKLGVSPKDAQSIISSKNSRDEVLAIFGVPISWVELTKSRAESVENNRNYQKITLKPRILIIEDKLNADLTPLYDPNIFFMYDPVVSEDRELNIKERDSRLDKGLTTINEERFEEGREPVEWGHVPILSNTMISFGSTQEAEPEKGITKAKKFVTVKQSEYTGDHPVDCGCGDHHKDLGLDEGHVRPLTEDQKKLKANMFAVLKRMGKDIQSNLDAYVPTPDISLFDMQKWTKEIGKAVNQDFTDYVVAGGTAGLKEVEEKSVKISASFDVHNPLVDEFIRQYNFKFATKYSAGFAEKLKETLESGIKNGETPAELVTRVEVIISDKALLIRAEAVARTESSRAYGMGRKMGWKQSGRVKGSKWVSFPGECMFCADMDGRYTDIDKAYFEQGDSLTVGVGDLVGTMNFDYDTVQSPPLHPYCRCVEVPVLI